MKTAHCKYSYANLEMILDLYFESNAFDLISPPLDGEALDEFIRKICDSMAYAVPKENMFTRFYVKKAFLVPAENQIKLLCTDGFLVDSALTLTVNQQAFAKERIAITEVDLVPAKFRLSSDILKTLNDRLPWFEDAMRKSKKTITILKESSKTEKRPEMKPAETEVATSRSYLADKTTDILSEIVMMKKEINEIVKSRRDTLDSLLNQVSSIRKQIYENVIKDTNVALKTKDSKQDYEKAVNDIIDRFSTELDQKIALAKQKASEITPISINFDNEIEDISHQIGRLSNMVFELKELTINKLYESAKEYYDYISPTLQTKTSNARKIMIYDFNRKFEKIARITEHGDLNSLNETDENLRNLTLETLQDIISNEDKNHLGLLQKCNTSWAEESKELQIVLKNLNQLNPAYKTFFQDLYPDFPFAKEDMVEIIRTPFPRNYQFKFTKYAFECRKMAEDFCKSKKEAIGNIAMEYKKKLQLDDVVDKTKRAMTEVSKVGATIKNAVLAYLDFLANQELADEIVESINKDYESIASSQNRAIEVQSFVVTHIDDKFKKLKKKINAYARDIETKVEAAKSIVDRVNHIKAEVKTMVDESDLLNADSPIFRGLRETIKSLKDDSHKIAAIFKEVENLNQTFALYHQVMIAPSYDFTEIKKQQAHAKNLVAHLIRDKATTLSQERRKQLVDLYTKIEADILNIDKLNNEVMGLKRQFLFELNKLDLTDEIFEHRMQTIRETFSAMRALENEISEYLAELKEF